MGPTVSLIKTKKERIFGGFTKVEWTNKKIMLKDENAFLFSINNKEKYDILSLKMQLIVFLINAL